ncbi:hypothetical protein F5Y12DRAFT_537718 [Xylaria sp. FL1777]|nr:hypothetical protein F5Y12DRAFT_537718 [Xylaria sp. FL1777]
MCHMSLRENNLPAIGHSVSAFHCCFSSYLPTWLGHTRPPPAQQQIGALPGVCCVIYIIPYTKYLLYMAILYIRLGC